jgi:hypothetical protein
MSNVNVQLNRGYVLPGNSVTATGGPYTVAADGTIAVVDSNEAAVRADIAALLAPTGAQTFPTPFALTIDGVNTATMTKRALLTVPAGKSAVITSIICRNSSAEQTTAVYGFGFDADCTNVVTPAAADLLGTADASKSIPLNWSAGGQSQSVGAPGDVFGIKVTTGDTPTMSVEVFGYYV